MSQYCVYLRKSRADAQAEARGEGETLARHKAALDELARRQGINVMETYREVVSGETIAARPVVQRLLAEVEQGLWAGVLVVEVERLARGDTIDQGTIAKVFKYSGTKIITPAKTYDPRDEFDEEFFEFSLFMSRREYKVINRRLQHGRLASVKEGKFVSNRPPYGYTRHKLEKEKGWTLKPHPEQTQVVRMIFDLYVTGEPREDGVRRLGTSLIARRLNEYRIPTSKGNSLWAVASVRDILINPVYIGKIRWNWKPTVKSMKGGQITVSRPRVKAEDWLVVDGLHQAIVGEDVFSMAQDIMKNNSCAPVPSRHVVKNSLAGVVYCGKCGRSMTRRPYNGTKYPDVLICPTPGCPTVSAFLDRVEARVLEALEQWLGEYKLPWGAGGCAPQNKPHLYLKKSALEKIDVELKMLDAQKGKLHDLLEQGVYDVQTYHARMRELSERTQQAQKSLATVESDMLREETCYEGHRTIVPKAESLSEVYRTLPSAKAKNDLLKEVVEKVLFVKESGGRWRSLPDSFEIKLYPRIPPAIDPHV